jgi:hypothetical protein
VIVAVSLVIAAQREHTARLDGLGDDRVGVGRARDHLRCSGPGCAGDGATPRQEDITLDRITVDGAR